MQANVILQPKYKKSKVLLYFDDIDIFSSLLKRYIHWGVLRFNDTGLIVYAWDNVQ